MLAEDILYSKDKIAVRRMRAEDLRLIETAEDNWSQDAEEYFQRQLARQEKGLCAALTAFCDGQLAGYVFLFWKCQWGGLRNRDIPSIVDLFVFEKYRKNGVATALLDTAESMASQYSDRIYLDVPVNNQHGAAQRLYIKRGYVPDGNGIYYDPDSDGHCVVCSADVEYMNNDNLTLCLVKAL